jgi:hypothetical protein
LKILRGTIKDSLKILTDLSPREERQLEENSLHNQHNVVTFLLNHVKLADHIPRIR